MCRKWGGALVEHTGKTTQASGSVLGTDFEKVGPGMLVHTFDPSKSSETRPAWSTE